MLTPFLNPSSSPFPLPRDADSLVPPDQRPDQRLAWGLALGFGLVCAACILGGMGGLLRPLYPLGVLVLGMVFYSRYPVFYLGFTWWVIFLTPFLYRQASYQTSWLPIDPMQLAPPLVTLVCLPELLMRGYRRITAAKLPFILSFSAIVYGTLVGLISNHPMEVFAGVCTWWPPVPMGFFVYSRWREYPALRNLLQSVFTWGTLVVSCYGVYQFFVAPPWDAAWMDYIEMLAFGLPEPFKIRVFSTMASPVPMAFALTAGLFTVLSRTNLPSLLATLVGFVAFLLSLVRGAWLGWIVGMFVLVPTLKPKVQMRLGIIALLLLGCLIPLLQMEPFSEVLLTRFESLGSSDDDISYQARTEGYNKLIAIAIQEFSGKGLGYTLDISGTSFGANDSGLLSTLLTLGWLGSIPYFIGMGMAMVAMYQSTRANQDVFVHTSRSIAIAVVSQIFLTIANIDVGGIVFWMFSGMVMAAHQYHRAADNSSDERF
jgi:hypothetical protein